ncbi:hypothetical protein EYC80_002462 [Monilinia laxa]|uniref:Uncharacterized protein n=1 Tax=Monilinia laxa TaxID=61186 RepID=A0A5N6K436_MONLA|nr:hypothetical protein EYC80_002462 [Monilinia laxa]
MFLFTILPKTSTIYSIDIMEKDELSLASELNPSPASFTPVRRKESTLNNGRLNRDVEQEWTAARCNRLLRPLTSRISILRKTKQSTLDRMKIQCKKGKSVSDSNIDSASEETKNNNASWIGRKRVKRTYSGKAGTRGSGQHVINSDHSFKLPSNSRSSSIPGEIIIPTPLLNRAWRNTSSPYRAIPYKGDALGYCQKMGTTSISGGSAKVRIQGTSKTQPLGPQALSKIRNSMSPTRFNVHEGIYNGLEALLRATHPISNIHKRGPRSLFSMCLAIVPKYITMEEKLLSNEIKRVGSHSAIEQRDISTEIYDDLELFGSSGRGWIHLQSVVRAHGVQIIRDAVSEGLLDLTEPNPDEISDFIIDPLYQMYTEESKDPGAEVSSDLAEKPFSAYNEAVRFISSVARCCGKGASTSGFEYLQHIHQRLKQVNPGSGLNARTALYGIIVDSAFAFAQVAPGQRYLDYADSLDGELHADSSRRPESARKESCYPSTAFRWEEGISSWVTATPATNTSKTRAKSNTPNFDSDDVELESPSISRAQRPGQLGRGSKRKADNDGYDQSTGSDIQPRSMFKNDTRREKASSFDIWLCDSSDDELNSSYESSQNNRVLKEVQNAATRHRIKLVETKRRKEGPTNHEKQSVGNDVRVIGQSVSSGKASEVGAPKVIYALADWICQCWMYTWKFCCVKKKLIPLMNSIRDFFCDKSMSPGTLNGNFPRGILYTLSSERVVMSITDLKRNE